MKNIDVNALLAPFKKMSHYFVVHQKIVYFIVGAVVMIAAFISLNLALYQPTDADYRAERESESQSSRFDNETIKKIQDLNASQQTRTDNVPAGLRANPFYE